MRFDIILTDPAWKYNNRLTGKGRTKFGSGASGKYRTEKTEDMAKFKVPDVSADPSMLLMWTTMPFLPDALWLMEQWKFKYTTVSHVWVKTLKEKPLGKLVSILKKRKLHDFMLANTRRLPGHYTASNVEMVLLGWHEGPILPEVKMDYQVIYAPPTRHSHKPPHVHEWIEQSYPGMRYLEMFATENRTGWTCLGNEIDGVDLRQSLPMLART